MMALTYSFVLDSMTELLDWSDAATAPAWPFAPLSQHGDDDDLARRSRTPHTCPGAVCVGVAVISSVACGSAQHRGTLLSCKGS